MGNQTGTAEKIARVLYSVRGVVDVLKFASFAAIRATFLWIGTLLIDLPALGLPAISWVQAVGIVLAVRAALTYTIGIQQTLPPMPRMPDLSQLFAQAQKEIDQEEAKS